MVLGVVPPERAGSATATSETAQEFGGALGMASRLPGAAGADLLRLARESFVGGLHAAAITAAVVLLVAAVVTTVLRRRFGPLEPHPGDRPVGRPGRCRPGSRVSGCLKPTTFTAR